MSAKREIEAEIRIISKGLDDNFTSTQDRNKKMYYIVKLSKAWEMLAQSGA